MENAQRPPGGPIATRFAGVFPPKNREADRAFAREMDYHISFDSGDEDETGANLGGFQPEDAQRTNVQVLQEMEADELSGSVSDVTSASSRLANPKTGGCMRLTTDEHCRQALQRPAQARRAGVHAA